MMFNKPKKEKNTYGIVGLGRFGYALAMELAASDADILVLDKDEEKVREMREYTESAYVMKTLDKKSLAETGIQNCDVAVVCIGEHMDTSILTTLNLVSLGIPVVIAKATSLEHGQILEKLGAEVVYPEHDMGVRLAHRLETSKMLIPDKIAGKTVLEVDLRGKFGLNIIAIENSGTVIDTVSPGYEFRKGDILFVAGSNAGLNRLSEWAERS